MKSIILLFRIDVNKLGILNKICISLNCYLYDMCSFGTPLVAS
jgi:DNA-binding Xre family transcriptional regulator